MLGYQNQLHGTVIQQTRQKLKLHGFFFLFSILNAQDYLMYLEIFLARDLCTLVIISYLNLFSSSSRSLSGRKLVSTSGSFPVNMRHQDDNLGNYSNLVLKTVTVVAQYCTRYINIW